VNAPRIVTRPAAARDIDDKAEELSLSSERIGERFLEAVNRSIQDLARMPGIGAPYPVSNPTLQGLRASLVRGKFRKHIIFYLPTDDGIEVVRILYGSRNVQRILEEEA
jgi:toxin ParE1/3/4